MRATSVMAVLVLLGLAACGEIEMHEVHLRAPSSPGSRDPELYMVEQAPPRPFQEVTLLQAIGRGDAAEIDDMRAALIARGRHLGCDAIVKVRFDQGYGVGQGVGVCVRWMVLVPAAPLAPAAPAPAPPPRETPL